MKLVINNVVYEKYTLNNLKRGTYEETFEGACVGANEATNLCKYPYSLCV